MNKKLIKNDLAFAFLINKNNKTSDPIVAEYDDELGKKMALLASSNGEESIRGIKLGADKLKNFEEILDDSYGKDAIFITEDKTFNRFSEYVNVLLNDSQSPSFKVNDAYLSSRLIIYKYVYYMLNRIENHNLNKNSLSRYIRPYIGKTVEELNIKKDENISFKTSLSSLIYNSGNNLIDVIWVGSARCYILTSKGLFLLSNDDIDDEGNLNNCFSTDESEKIHHKEYKWNDIKNKLGISQDKFILISATEGFNNNFSNSFLNDEYHLIDTLSFSDDIDEFKQELKERLRKNTKDDVSFSMYPVGFSSFDDMKDHFLNRFEEIEELYYEYVNYKKEMDILNNKNIEKYIESRIINSISLFREKIIDDAKIDDTPFFSIGEKLKDEKAQIKYIIRLLKPDEIRMNLKDGVDLDVLGNNLKKIIIRYEELVNNKDELCIIKNKIEKLLKDIIDGSSVDDIDNEIEEISILLSNVDKTKLDDNLKKNIEITINNIKKMNALKKTKPDDFKIEIQTTSSMIYLAKLITKKNNAELIALKEAFEDRWNSFVYKKSYDELSEIIKFKATTNNVIVKSILQQVSDEELYSEIIRVIGSYNNPTCIDDLFDEDKFLEYKEYMRFKNDEALNEIIKALNKKLSKFENNYLSLL